MTHFVASIKAPGLGVLAIVVAVSPADAQLRPPKQDVFRPATTEQKTRELRDLHEPSEAAGKRSIELSRRGPWLSAKTLENSRTMASRSASGGSGDASRTALLGPYEHELVAASIDSNAAPTDSVVRDEVLVAAIRYCLEADRLSNQASTIFVGVGDTLGSPPATLLQILNQKGDTIGPNFVPAAGILREAGEAAKDPGSGVSGPVIQLVEWSITGPTSASISVTTRDRIGTSRTRVFEVRSDAAGAWKVVEESDYRVGAR